MYTVIVVSIIALALTFLNSRGQLRGGMAYGFMLLTFLGAIHYDYGNDYMGYYDIYKDVNEHTFDLALIFSGEVFKEPGWALLCYLFKPLGGFFTMVAVLNVIQNTIVYRMIKREVERKWWPFALSIYLFNTSFYLLSFSMMRQALVMYVFLALWPLIKQRKIILTLLILLLCSTIHTSSIILVPFAFIGYLPVKKGRMLSLVLIILFFLVWWQRDVLNDVLKVMSVMENVSKYEEVYADSDHTLTFGIGYLVGLIPLILSFFYIAKKRDDEDATRLVVLSSVGYLLAPFSSIIPLISRLSYYFGMYSIIATYRIYSGLTNAYLKYVLLFLYFLMMLFGYYGFFQSPIFGEYYNKFDTIFSVLFEEWIIYFSVWSHLLGL